ncbi:diamine acetyltransferase 1-like isoform X5 [Stegostoma tigrinum]|uniref:diamine acetyltransferase 1-like isoform X5 n=1 Tax=Stegostoma tigrinum TaxID=3053191 RepID=UPI0028703AC9|nr:diamine acetyltransferase 1-like isoform X5 [Stegostoma tigrinum]
MTFTVREARPEDSEQIVRMIKELAAYEKLADQVAQTTEGLVQDGFTQAPYYKCLVAEVPADQACRGQGIGSAFLRVVAEIALQNKCSLLNFVVLSANFPGIDFYQAKGAVDLTKLEGCHLFRFEQEQLAKLAAGKGQNVTAPPSQ